jgi:ketosteroid isomerase-like protein
LKKLNADWIASYVTKDSTTMSRIFADDLVLTNPGGTAMSKKDILNGLMSPGQQFLSTKVDTLDVSQFGNIGIINAKITGIVKANGQTITVRTCYLDVYEKRKGRWYAVAAHVTLLDPN